MARLDAGTVKTREGAPSKQPPNKGSLKDMMGAQPGKPTSLKGVLFGPPKTFKTTIACSGGRTLLINFDPEGYATGTLKGRKDIDIIEPENLAEMNKVIEGIIGGEADEYDWIVVDSVTFMFQKFGGKEILKTFQQGKDVRRAYGYAGSAAGQVIHDLAMIKDKNIMFIAHLKKEYDDEDSVAVDQDLGEHEVSLAVTPMVWNLLGPAVGFIGRTYKENISSIEGNTETKFFVSFNDGSRSPAGSRYEMAGLYEASDTLLKDLANDLL